MTLMVAPFCPFVAEEMYGILVAAHDPAAPESVHLADWPAPRGRRDPGLEDAMAAAREAVAVGRGARAEARLKVRQPLAEAVVAAPPALARSIEGLVDLVAEELNVRRVRFVTDPAELVEVTVKPNYRRLGPRFGKRMPAVAAAVAALPAAESARAIDAGDGVEIALNGDRERLAPEDLLLEARPSEGYAVGQDAALAVGLATEITPDLRREALAREVVHAVQGARRAAGLRVEERIHLHLDGSGELREADRGAPRRDRRRDPRDAPHGRPRRPVRGAAPRGARHRWRAARAAAGARRLGSAAAPGGGARARHHVGVGAQAAPHALGVEPEPLDQLRQLQDQARVLQAQPHDLAVAADEHDALLHVLFLHVGEGLDVAQREVDRRAWAPQSSRASRWAVTARSRRAVRTAPAMRSTGSPSRNRIRVGRERTS